jgi:hypothetical protein
MVSLNGKVNFVSPPYSNCHKIMQVKAFQFSKFDY